MSKLTARVSHTLLLLLVLLASHGPARADEVANLSPQERRARSKSLYEEGRIYFNLGNYPAAISAFERAYVLSPLPLFLYNLAQLASLTGDRERAKHLYERFLDEAPAAPERAEVEQRIRELKRSLANPPQSPPPSAAAPAAAPINSPTVVPAPPAPVATPAALTEPTPALTQQAPSVAPRRRRAWIAGVVVGTAAILGVAIGLGVYYGTREVDPTPSLGRGVLQ